MSIPTNETLAAALTQAEADYGRAIADWTTQAARIRQLRLDLECLPAAISEYGRDLLEHALGADDRAAATIILNAAAKLALVRPKLEIDEPTYKDIATATSRWKSHFLESLRANAKPEAEEV